MASRRDFFKISGRLAILSGVGLMSAFLAYNQKIETPDKCSIAPQCKNCGKLSQCLLPQAEKERIDGNQMSALQKVATS